jgi:hypothetical protein
MSPELLRPRLKTRALAVDYQAIEIEDQGSDDGDTLAISS